MHAIIIGDGLTFSSAVILLNRKEFFVERWKLKVDTNCRAEFCQGLQVQ